MLSGDLAVFGLPAVLRFVCEHKVDGRLDVVGDEDGGSFIVSAGRIRAIALRDRDPTDEDSAIDAALELLRIRGGEFSVHEVLDVEGPMEVPVDELLERVGAREREEQAAAETLGGFDVPLRLASRPRSDTVTISAGEWSLLALVDGRRGAAEIAAGAGGSRIRALSALAELVRGGLVERSDAPAPEGDRPEAEASREPKADEAEPAPEAEEGEPEEAAEESDVDPAALLRELGGANRPKGVSRLRIPTREEQRLRLRK